MTDDVTAVPLQEAINADDGAPAAPRRGRGRPRGSKTRRLGSPPPVAGAARPRSERAPSRPTVSRASIKTRVGGLLVTVNMALLIVPPLHADALSPGELEALAGAIETQCQQSPRFKRYVEAALSAGAGGQLLGVVAMIGARRAARHGAFGDGGAMIDAMLGGMFNEPKLPNEPTPIPDMHDIVADEYNEAVDTRPSWTPPHEPENNGLGAAGFDFEATLAPVV